MFVWPDRQAIDRAMTPWAAQQRRQKPELLRLGYFGSYARGDWGPGSDLDLVAIVRESRSPFGERALDWDLTSLPVPAEILIYTEEEWLQMQREPNRFAQMLTSDTVWF